MTDRATGEIVSLAPNYDNNTSIFANANLTRERKGGVLSLFLTFVQENRIPLPGLAIDPDDITEVVQEAKDAVGCDFDENGFLAEFLYNGVEKVRTIHEKKHE